MSDTLISIIFVIILVLIMLAVMIPKKCPRCNHYDIHDEYSTPQNGWDIHVTHICKHCHYIYTTSLKERLKKLFSNTH